MRTWLFLVVAFVAATGKLVHAEPSDQVRNRVGADGVGGIGIFELIGGSLRLEDSASASGALLLRVGHLQMRSVDNETKELDPFYFVHGGYRHYWNWLYFSFEGGVIAGHDSRGWHGRPNAAVTLGAKSTAAHVDLGISIMAPALLGVSLCAHVGFDFVSW